MKKSELVLIIAQKLDISKSEAHLFVNTMLESITEVLKENEDVNLQKFGHFLPKQRKERPVRNPKTGTSCRLEPIRTIKFRPSRTLIGRIN